MKADQLKAAHDDRPFRPFTIHMPDGRHYAVPTAGFMAMKPDSPRVFVWNLHDSGYALIGIDQIVRLEFEGVPQEIRDR
jgi:hypothetical protein